MFRKRLSRHAGFAAALAVVLGIAVPAGAQAPLPERRAVVVPDADLYGGDLRALMDTGFDACLAACLGDAACKAITYNTAASACFLKSGYDDIRGYPGAVSARIVEADAPVMTLAGERAADLGFLPEGYLGEARELAANIGLWYPPSGRTAAELAADSEIAARRRDWRRAASLRAAVLNLEDSAGGWAELARLYLESGTNAARKSAVAAAVNAYLRAASLPDQSLALHRLAEALEARGEGRAAIAPLRLAQRLLPSPETEEALFRAASLFGFRVLEHSVGADAARPRICLIFSEPLAEAGVDYAMYLRTEDAGLAVEAEDTQLCIDGVAHGRSYRLTLRAGLPAASGETLPRAADLDVYVRDRAPSLRFLGRAYVLPKAGPGAIPLVSVNLDEAELAIHRVGDRNLVRVIQDGLFEDPLSGYAERRLDNSLGAPVWTGTAVVERRLNADVTTAIPIGEAVTSFEPGVYAMTARVPGEQEMWEGAATQWFVVTDLGLISATGEDGLHVFVRRLSDAGAASGARLSLVAANNEVLGGATTDADGHAVFAPGLTRGTGGSAPALLTVEDGAGDFAFLDLSRPGFDLSDRGVEGRAPPQPVDVFLTTERGAYRPGETVHATILARDARAEAVPGLALTAILFRPDGVESARHLLPDQGAGGRALSLPLDPGARRGAWRLNIHADPKAPPLASATFLVEDFLPERIDFDLTMPDGPVAASDVPEVEISARYLYGAPGAGLTIEGEARISAASSLPGHPGYRFGLEDDTVSASAEPVPPGLVTDADGGAAVPLRLPEIAATTRPLELTAVLRLTDGSGRPVERQLSRPIAPDGLRIGIRPLFYGAVEEGGLARFEIIAVGPDLARAGLPRVAWTLSRVDTRYQWYRLNGTWNYEPVTSRERVASGETAPTPEDVAVIEAPVHWGHYELKAVNLHGPYTATSFGFNAGWYAVGSSSDTPDRLELGLDRKAYAVGDTATVRLTARAAGTALVMVADTGLIDMRAVAVAPGETELRLPVTDSWGPGAYVTAMLLTPMDAAAGRNPARALGLAWATVDPGPRRIAAHFETPDEAAPRGPLDAVLQLDGLAPGEAAYATIAAVDLGILNLTGFEAPAPDDWYFGQRRLGVEFRDLYGRLIDGLQGAPGRIRSGGDGGLARMQAPPPTQDLVAFFSGPVTVDAQSRATARFDLPDFNGTVRLMAVVWSGTGVGHAVKDVLVRDPVVVTAATPRFLAPGDRSRVLVELAHTSGPAGAVTVALAAGTGLTLGDGATRTVTVAEGGRAALQMPVLADAVGDSELRLAVTTPDGRRLEKTLRLGVRANDPEVARQNRIPLAATGGRLTIDSGAFDGLVPGTGRATLAVGPAARFDVPGLLLALDRYPYGCTEQVISRALPLVYFDRVAAAMGLTERETTAERVAAAIRAVLANQTAAGAFGLWRPHGGDLWLDAYVTDFLSRARGARHAVPDQAFRAALSNLRNAVAYAGDFEKGGEAIAYALMVLARESMASIGDLRYYADARAEAFATPLAKAQIGAGLAFHGEQKRADAMFRLAARQLAAEGHEDPAWRVDYGSYHRDAAAVLALAVEAGSKAVDIDKLSTRLTDWRYGDTSTQEKVWTLLAADAMIRDTQTGSLTVDGVPAGGPLIRLIEPASLADGDSITIENTGDAATEAVLTTFGVPAEPQPAGGNGYILTRAYYSMAGEPVSTRAVAQNTRLIAVLTVIGSRRGAARLMVDDPLPAGFEIDNPNLLRGGGALPDWIDPPDEPAYVEFRSDRFLATVDSSGNGRFQLAYVVRAVSPGRFHHPAASVEDMYRPQFRAWTAAGAIEVLGPVR
jgi:hypothetical protein